MAAMGKGIGTGVLRDNGLILVVVAHTGRRAVRASDSSSNRYFGLQFVESM